MAGSEVAAVGDGQLIVCDGTKHSGPPNVAVVVSEVDTAVVPRVAISIEAASRLNGDEG